MALPKVQKETLVAGVMAGAAVAAILFKRLNQQSSTRASWMRTITFDSKWDKFVGVDPSQLLVITDFDATVTAGDADQCHDLLGISPVLSKAFKDDFAPLLDWTTNASIDGVEWWDRAHECMLKHGMLWKRHKIKTCVEC